MTAAVDLADRLSYFSRFPSFPDRAAVERAPVWRNYLHNVYSLPTLRFPLDLSNFWVFYLPLLPATHKPALPLPLLGLKDGAQLDESDATVNARRRNSYNQVDRRYSGRVHGEPYALYVLPASRRNLTAWVYQYAVPAYARARDDQQPPAVQFSEVGGKVEVFHCEEADRAPHASPTLAVGQQLLVLRATTPTDPHPHP